MDYKSNSQLKTTQIGQGLASKLKGGDVVLLHGELGAGKTTFVKGIAEGLGIKDDIVSPTFTLMQIYEVKSIKYKVEGFVHIDTYRLKNEDELKEIGVEDYLGDEETVCVVEWPEKMRGLLRDKKTIDVTIESIGENERRIKIKD